MKYILSNPRLAKSAKLLADKIGTILGEQILVKTRVNNLQDKLIIRYGTSVYSRVFDDVNHNSPTHIRMAGNKLNLSEYLTDKDFPHVELCNGHPEDFPICVRKELNRGGGIGIEIYENKELFMLDYNNWLNPYYWSKWYNFQFELGVHILGGEIVKVFKKVREVGLEEKKYPIRNTQRGYDFKLKPNWKESYTGLEKFVAELYKVFPIQFARLDIGYDKETGGYRLIEINSAPDLSQNKNTLELYARFLAERMGEIDAR